MTKANLLSKDKLPYLILIGILLLYIFYLQACASCTKIEPAKPQIQTTVITKTHVDTVYKEIKSKSLSGITTKVSPDIPKTDSLPCPLATYNTTIKDSLLTAIITSRVAGTLEDVRLEYTAKFPTIYITDSVFTTNTVTVEKAKKLRSIALGVDVGGNLNMFTGSAFIQYSDRKQFIYGFRYDVVNKTYNLQVGKRFNLEK